MNAKIMAMMMVGVMMFSGLAITMGNNDNTLDAVVGDGGAYSYTLNYHTNQMNATAAQELQLTVDGMTPISHTNSGVLESLNEGSWTWNTTTGIGPFNSFYAAFDITDGNKFVAILDPYDLSKTISGSSLPSGSYNIMWVLPTVYWSVSNGNLTLTNDPSAGGTAYAHTINGHTYNYIAIGVYEGTSYDSNSVLTSETGKKPYGSATRATLRTMAHNYTMDDSLNTDPNNPAYSMLLNFYQMELYRYCSLMVMEGFNSQAIVGNGMVGLSTIPSNYANGSLDALGPYAGMIGLLDSSDITTYGSDMVKLFIENSWGGYSELIDGVMLSNKTTIFLDSKDTPDDSTTAGTYVTSKTVAIPNGAGPKAIETDSAIWGLGSGTGGSVTNSIGLCDYLSCGSGLTIMLSDKGLYDAGNTNTTKYPGINFANFYIGTDYSYQYNTARLAFVFDADPTISSYSVSFDTDGSGYGSLSDSSTITNVEDGSTISISGNTLTIDGISRIATPTADTAQYDYSFTGWYNGSTQLVGGETVTGDMTITAHFARSLNDYTVTATASSYGSVSPASVTQPYGSAISASGNVLTIGSQTITATPDAADAQYTYTFTGWSTFPSTLTENTSVTANFDRTVNTYTITWSVSGSTTSETLSYGAMPEHEDPVPPEGYLFAGWNPEIAAVTGDQTYTAVFEEIVYITVTFDPNGGQLEGSATKTVGIGTPYGELPTPKKDNNKFLGWYTDAEEGTLVTADTIVTADADQTLYAHWELTGFAAMLKPLLFLFPLILLAFLAIALVRTFA